MSRFSDCRHRLFQGLEMSRFKRRYDRESPRSSLSVVRSHLSRTACAFILQGADDKARDVTKRSEIHRWAKGGDARTFTESPKTIQKPRYGSGLQPRPANGTRRSVSV